MSRSGINYQSSFARFFEQIKIMRDPHSERHEGTDSIIQEIKNERLFDFGGSAVDKTHDLFQRARTYALSTLQSLFLALFQFYGCSTELIQDDLPKEDKMQEIAFAFIDKKNNRLLVFKDTEEDLFYKAEKEPKPIADLMQKYNAVTCMYIYFVYDKAELQVFSKNPNVVSLPWLFKTYFSEEEYEQFKLAALSFTEQVKEYFGFIQIKTLTSKTLISFKRHVDNRLRSFDYKQFLQNYEIPLSVSEEEYKSIVDQFINNGLYTIMLGRSEYAESFITAEWLYRSMRAAKAIDLTIIAMGYFKAIEQLYYAVICLHKGEGRHIRCGKRCDYCSRAQDMACFSQRHTVPVSDLSINENFIDSTIGSMERFFRDNKSLMRDDISNEARTNIVIILSDAHKMRNGYMHKQNIHEWEIIDNVRDLAYALLFLLLGSYRYTNEDAISLGKPDSTPYTDFYRLCEYFNYHSGNLFHFYRNDGAEMHVFARPDMRTNMNPKGFIEYSGVYFSIFGEEQKRIYFMNEANVPSRIYSSKIKFGWEGEIRFDLEDISLIYENKAFCGPSITDEESHEY